MKLKKVKSLGNFLFYLSFIPVALIIVPVILFLTFHFNEFLFFALFIFVSSGMLVWMIFTLNVILQTAVRKLESYQVLELDLK